MTDELIAHRETLARALSIPEHHTSWDTLSNFEKSRFYMQADYVIGALSPQPPAETDDAVVFLSSVCGKHHDDSCQSCASAKATNDQRIKATPNIAEATGIAFVSTGDDELVARLKSRDQAFVDAVGLGIAERYYKIKGFAPPPWYGVTSECPNGRQPLSLQERCQFSAMAVAALDAAASRLEALSRKGRE